MSTKKTAKGQAKKTAAKAPKAAKAEAVVKKAPVQVVETRELYFTREEMNELELAQLRAKAAKQDVDLAEAQARAFAAEAQGKLKALNDEIGNRNATFKKQGEALSALYLKLESKHGISMNRISYNPESGRINFLPTTGDSAQG